MTIALNLWIFKAKHLDGIGRYCLNLFQTIIQQNPEKNFHLLLPTNFNETWFDYKNVKKIKIFPPYRHPLLYLIWMQIILPLYLRFTKIDKIICADGMMSLGLKTPQIAIIYDLNFLINPKYIKNRIQSAYYRYFYPQFIRHAEEIVTISEFSKNEIERFYPDLKTRIHIIYPNAHLQGAKIEKMEQIKTKEKYAFSQDYFLFIGSLIPRKNLLNQLNAFLKFLEQTQDNNIKFLVVGQNLWQSDYMAQFRHPQIIFLGQIDDENLYKILQSALALSFVSSYEGFGMPILEGFSAQVPVITANKTAMPEIAKDAAICVSPDDIDAVKQAYLAIYKNENNLRESLISKGLKRVEDFSWQRSAEALSNILQ